MPSIRIPQIDEVAYVYLLLEFQNSADPWMALHNSHAFTPQGVPLGVVSADCLARQPASPRLLVRAS